MVINYNNSNTYCDCECVLVTAHIFGMGKMLGFLLFYLYLCYCLFVLWTQIWLELKLTFKEEEEEQIRILKKRFNGSSLLPKQGRVHYVYECDDCACA